MSDVSKGFVVVADDEPSILGLLDFRLVDWGYRCEGVSNKADLMTALDRERPCLLILDLYFGKSNGIALLKEILEKHPGLMIVILTGNATIVDAVNAVKQGANDFLPKPPDWLRLEMILNHSVRQHALNQRIKSLEHSVELVNNARTLYGQSPAIRAVRDLIATVAHTDVPVLILGESGTGKELIARELHEKSPRAKEPFVAVNMAALPKSLIESTLFGHEKGAFTGADKTRFGCFEQADQGTLLLDEIGDMDMEQQAKLLRVLQERTYERVGSSKSNPVQCRVISATNRNLLDAVRAGTFREDLYYRLNVVPIQIQPLRQRREDIPVLANRFLRRAALRYHKDINGFTPQAANLLLRYDWPGNVRQLENLVERMVILSPSGSEIGVATIPHEILEATGAASSESTTSDSNGETLDKGPLLRFESIERQAIVDALQEAKGNIRIAAETLGLGQATIYRKVKRYQIDLAETGRTRSESVVKG